MPDNISILPPGTLHEARDIMIEGYRSFIVTEKKVLAACKAGDVERLKFLLDRGANVETKDVQLRTLLIEAAANRNLEMVQLLIDHKADVNEGDCKEVTPLMEAVRIGNADIVEALIRAGSDVNASNLRGWTALMRATYYGHPKIALSLLTHGAKPNTRNIKGRKALDFLRLNKKRMRKFRNTEALKILLEAEAEEKASQKKGSSK